MLINAVYLDSSERFLFVHDDLWLCMMGCKLLSSKFNMAICKINSNDISNDNCLEYTLSKKQTAIFSQDNHYPRLLRFENSDDIRIDNRFEDTEKGILLKHQQFSIFVLKVLEAAWVTDALLNNDDRRFFQELLGINDVVSEHDDTGLKDGFLKNIYRILYLSLSEKDILDSITDLFNNTDSILPRNLEIYKNVFYKNLEI